MSAYGLIISLNEIVKKDVYFSKVTGNNVYRIIGNSVTVLGTLITADTGQVIVQSVQSNAYTSYNLDMKVRIDFKNHELLEDFVMSLEDPHST